MYCRYFVTDCFTELRCMQLFNVKTLTICIKCFFTTYTLVSDEYLKLTRNQKYYIDRRQNNLLLDSYVCR